MFSPSPAKKAKLEGANQGTEVTKNPRAEGPIRHGQISAFNRPNPQEGGRTEMQVSAYLNIFFLIETTF